MSDSRVMNGQSRHMFDGIARSYEGPAEVFSFFQYGRWRRFLVSQIDVSPEALVADVCTGTGLVASDIMRRVGCRVIAIDLADQMIEQAQHNLARDSVTSSVSLVKGLAESLPFLDASFDAVVFTFLLRYVANPEATLQELSRVLRPGGQMLSLEFFVPVNPVVRTLWLLHTHALLPLCTKLLTPGWRTVGSFLGQSIFSFYRAHSLEDVKGMWIRAGFSNLQTRLLSFGGAVVIWGQKEFGQH